MNMHRILFSIAAMMIMAGAIGQGKRSGIPRVLVFSKTAGFRHKSIDVGKKAIMELGRKNGFRADTTEDATRFNEDSLRLYSAVVFLSATGNVLDAGQQASFERYIQAGGGFAGIHAASDCEYGWPWYGRLVGAYFKSHPKIQKASLQVVDRTHESTRHLPETWERSDEWYNFRRVPADSEVHVLIRIDEKSYEGGQNGDDHPMAWYHAFDGGRAFYTELGHTDESFADPAFLQHILGGIRYAIGANLLLDYGKARSMKVPEEDRFTKNIIATGFDEPTEMAILPNLDVLVVQRKGGILRYDAAARKLTELAQLKVYSKANVKNVNAEEGLMGIAADPDFARNNHVYLFYAAPDTPMNRLSRFTYRDGRFDLSSERKVMEFYSQRDICCHTGGSIAFGPDGLLYLSSGDNTTPFDQPVPFKNHGFAPIDQRAGLEQYDAGRTSGNPNDLRGKIMRIRVKPDGSYEIPSGNLFPPGTEGTRPEIYVMGNRNPYRISVDRKSGFLYWGEVGPDASNDSMQTRGPRGYDELNQARKAGFFGWPFFVGNNYPYRSFDYTTGKSGEAFDPLKPMNRSKNNTGIQQLPPVSPAFIWYPYAVSPDFPELGTGGRNAMAGPVYHSQFYPASTRFPDYFNGKLFFYDWIRGWVKIVTMDGEGNYQQMEPFLSTTKLNSPIDMEMGPDGRLYILEYGTGWFSKNADAALSRVDYNGGNRAPKARLQVDRTSGALPFKVVANAAGSSDPDKDAVTYTYDFGNGKTVTTSAQKAEHTYTKPGTYEIHLVARDAKGLKTRSESLTVHAGNEAPQVRIDLDPPQEHYYPGNPVRYAVKVQDREDGSTDKGGIDPASLFVKVDYLSGPDKAQVVGHQAVSVLAEGRNLAMSLDCKTCHRENEQSIGPAYAMVSSKYSKVPDARKYLVEKVIKGGSGVWGEVPMAAHPDLREGDAGRIVDWILSLASEKNVASLPASGSVTPEAKDASGNRVMVITASYTDKGAVGVGPLTGVASVTLRSPLLGVRDNKGSENMTFVDYNGTRLAVVGGERGWLMFENVSLGRIKTVELGYGLQNPLQYGYVVELFADRVGGVRLGEGRVPEGGNAGGMSALRIPVMNAEGLPRRLYIVVRKADARESNMLALSGLRLLTD